MSKIEQRLHEMGMTLPFRTMADFSPMCGCRIGSIAIQSVAHSSYVRVDEKGTVAAAATAVEIHLTAIHIQSAPPFIVNKPFVLAIRDEHTGALLFIGVINSVSGT